MSSRADAKAGNFRIEISSPYPCWITVIYRDTNLGQFSHSELADLEFCVKRAKQFARLALGKDRDEV